MNAYFIYLLFVQYCNYNLNVLQEHIHSSAGISEVNIGNSKRMDMGTLEKKRILDILQNENVSVNTKLALIDTLSTERVATYDLTKGNLWKDW